MLKSEPIELYLPRLFAQGPRYGCELPRPLHDAFPDTQESAVCAILRGPWKEGDTRSFAGETSGGPVRKYHEPTDAEREKHASLLDARRKMCAAPDQSGIEHRFFGKITPCGCAALFDS